MEAAAELANLKFSPRSSAWKHVQRFEKLCREAYPRIPDPQKWTMFVKTIDANARDSWAGRPGPSPGQWLQDLNERWMRDNPPCEDPDCHDCANDTMSFDYLKTSFLDHWGGDERPTNRRPHSHGPSPHPGPPSRSYSMPPHSALDSGSDTESVGPAPRALIPHSRLPPSAPTPPNEPVSEPEFVETKTSISINAENISGGGQIVLSISDNKKKRRSQGPGQGQGQGKGLPPVAPAPPDSGADDSRPNSPNPDYGNGRSHSHHRTRQIEAAPPPCHRPAQVIEADPSTQMMEIYTGKPGPTSTDSGPHSRPPTPPRDMSTPPPPPLRPRILEGKVAAITGSSRGIGRALALGFAREGAHIIAHYWGTKSDPANEEIVSLCVAIRSLGQGCTIVFGDISDPKTSENIIKRAVEIHGRLDIAVSNAGMCWYREFLEVTPELLKRHTDVNLHGAFYFIQAAARQFKKQHLQAPADEPMRDYSIISVASAAAGAEPAMETHFAAAEAGVRELMRSAARGLARYGVRCNTLAPGVTQTKMVREVMEEEGRRKGLESACPYGRVGVPGDVVGPAVWLAGELGRWVTGQEVKVDGGVSASWW